jgi:hypothetical protein
LAGIPLFELPAAVGSVVADSAAVEVRADGAHRRYLLKYSASARRVIRRIDTTLCLQRDGRHRSDLPDFRKSTGHIVGAVDVAVLTVREAHDSFPTV